MNPKSNDREADVLTTTPPQTAVNSCVTLFTCDVLSEGFKPVRALKAFGRQSLIQKQVVRVRGTSHQRRFPTFRSSKQLEMRLISIG